MDDQDKQVLTAKTPAVQPEPVPSPAPAKGKKRTLWLVIGVTALCLALCACVAIGAGTAYGLSRARAKLSLQALPRVDIGPPARVGPPVRVRPPMGRRRGEFLQSGTGALIVEVIEDSPAEQAGLAEGNVIVAVDDQILDHEHNLAGLIAGYKPQDKVTLQVIAFDGASHKVEVELGEHPDQKSAPYLGVHYVPLSDLMDQGGRFGPFDQHEFHFERGGPGEGEFDQHLYRFFGDVPLEGGAVIAQVFEGSPAAGAGLETGDVIVAVDGVPVDGPEALQDLVSGLEPGDSISLTVYRAGSEGEIEIEVTLGEHPEDEGQAYLGVYLGEFFHMERSPEGGEGLHHFQFFGLPGLPHSELPGDELLREFEFRWPPEGEDQDLSDLFGDTL
jgi:S1-C subfamily serine protease